MVINLTIASPWQLHHSESEDTVKYLKEKQGSKGKEIQYDKIEMSEYLLPFNNQLSIEGKQRLFSARNKMVNISSNFSSSKLETKCICSEQESMQHIYNSCKMLNIDNKALPYEKIYSGEVYEQIEVLQKLEQNLEIRDNLMNPQHEPCDPSGSAAYISSFG